MSELKLPFSKRLKLRLWVYRFNPDNFKDVGSIIEKVDKLKVMITGKEHIVYNNCQFKIQTRYPNMIHLIDEVEVILQELLKAKSCKSVIKYHEYLSTIEVNLDEFYAIGYRGNILALLDGVRLVLTLYQRLLREMREGHVKPTKTDMELLNVRLVFIIKYVRLIAIRALGMDIELGGSYERR